MPARSSDWQRLLGRFLEGGLLEWLSFFATILVLAAIVWLIVRVRAWFRDDVDAAESDQELLIQMMEMNRQGDLTDEEFRSIKGRLAARLKSSSQADSPDTSPPSNGQ